MNYQLENGHSINDEFCAFMNLSDLKKRLQQIWGYSDFRTPQGEIVQTLLAKRDALIILPTGGGKSLCFQLPALMQTGVTIVISPLVALMENQVQELHDRRLPAALLHSELPSLKRKQVLQSLEACQLRLLYLSPETLLTPQVWQKLCNPSLIINALILDEAHCLTQWGQTFRPVYYRLGAVRSALLKHKPAGTRIAIAAFTATADPLTQATIQRILNLENPEIFRFNPYRSNLTLAFQSVSTPRQRRQQLLDAIQPGKAGLVYVRSRKDSEELTTWLKQKGFKTAAYHAGLTASERRSIEQQWLSDRIQFVVCTSAFGMGINKPDTRWVIQFHAPLLLSEYVQEIGRAGRDEKPAIALLLKSSWLDADDRQRWKFFEEQTRSQLTTAQKLAHQLPKQGNIDQVMKQFQGAAIALSLLQHSEQLVWADPFHYEIQTNQKIQQRSLNSTQAMKDYLNTKDCRWTYLLRSFGFEQDAQSFACGNCDRCTK
jgi:ATP-dependent DNA helicase RecQ